MRLLDKTEPGSDREKSLVYLLALFAGADNQPRLHQYLKSGDLAWHIQLAGLLAKWGDPAGAAVLHVRILQGAA